MTDPPVYFAVVNSFGRLSWQISILCLTTDARTPTHSILPTSPMPAVYMSVNHMPDIYIHTHTHIYIYSGFGRHPYSRVYCIFACLLHRQSLHFSVRLIWVREGQVKPMTYGYIYIYIYTHTHTNTATWWNDNTNTRPFHLPPSPFQKSQHSHGTSRFYDTSTEQLTSCVNNG